MDQIEQQILDEISQESTRERGFNLLLDHYQSRLYWNIRRIVISHDDADDVLQNTCIKIWNSLAYFKSQSSLYTWLYRISVNEALQHLRSQKRKVFFGQEEIQNHLIQKLESDPYFDGDELQKKLQEAILLLPEKQRMIFNMRYYDELKYEEISQILGTTTGGLKASYHLALKKLEKYLTNN